MKLSIWHHHDTTDSINTNTITVKPSLFIPLSGLVLPWVMLTTPAIAEDRLSVDNQSSINLAIKDLTQSSQLYTDVSNATKNIDTQSDSLLNNQSTQVDTEVSNRQFMACRSLTSQSARLKCFDTLVDTGEIQYAPDKKQVHLAQTLKSTFSGSPQIVMFDANTTDIDAPTAFYHQSENQPNTKITTRLVSKTVNYLKDLTNRSDTSTTSQLSKSTINAANANTEDSESDELNSNGLNTDVKVQSDKTVTKDLKQPIIKANQQSYKVIEQEPSSLSKMHDLDYNSEVGTWKARPHNPTYLIPLLMHDKPNLTPQSPSQEPVTKTQNDFRSPELKFQLSFKSKVAQDLFDTDADLWMGYTQQSHWQVYNEDNSRPFRAHDYQPELFLTQPVYAELPFDGRLRMLGAGVIHHSNGEDDPLSRSWNRAYLMAGAEWDNQWGKLTIMPKVWKRLVADVSTKKNENPDIEDYYGYGDVKVYYDMNSGQSIAGNFRLNPVTGKGSAEIDYMYPMDNNVNLFVNVFHGYGESLIDYNHKDTTVGVGVMLNDWRGL